MIDAFDRFISKIAISELEYEGTPCWEWTGFLNKDGYGQFSMYGRYVRPHRWAYEYFIKPIPKGFVADHLCNNPRCVNAVHIQACLQKVNVLRGNAPTAINARKTHCPKGHEFNKQNTLTSNDRRRHCRVCDRERKRVCH